MPDLTIYEYDIFLSHNHRDQEWTTKLAERLEEEEWRGRKLKVFFSPWDIRPGQSIPKEIERALPKSRKVGLVLSPDAMASAWVELERLVTSYIDISERDARLIPLLRKECDIPALLKPILSIDFSSDDAFADSYRTLLTVIKDEPLPRGSFAAFAEAKPVLPLIPRPPIVGFVARRDSEGRDIVERLKEELAPEKNQLVALSGPGGVGKTTLAAEATRALSEGFGSRIVWAGALGREDFALSTLLDEIATQLGRAELRPLAPEPKAERVQALIASSQTLIILDNFETIKAAEQKRCGEFLLNRATCPALITTRQRIDSARNIIIPVMSDEEADDFLQRLIEQASDKSAFEQPDRNRIKQASERNPLVLQWVVGQIDLAQDANTVLEDLAQGVGDAAQRVFDRSFGLEQLGEDGRATLLALSLFVPDASRAALGEVAGFGHDLKRLNEAVKHLAGLYLVKTIVGGHRLTVGGLTRELARTRLSKDVRGEDIRTGFLSYFLGFSESHANPTHGDYDLLEEEKDNVLSAMDVAVDMSDWNALMSFSYAIAIPGSGMLDVHGYWDEAIRRNAQALKAAQELASDGDIAAFAHNLAIMRHNRGELDEARRLYNLSMKIAEKAGDQTRIANSLHELGRLAQGQGEFDKARRLYEDSLEIEMNLENQSGIAISLHQLGKLAHVQGQFDEARKLYNDSLKIEKELDNESGIATSKHALANLARDERDFAEARRLYNESLEIINRLGDRNGLAYIYLNLGLLEEGENNETNAVGLFRKALAIFEELGSSKAEIARQSLKRAEGKSSVLPEPRNVDGCG